MVGAVHAMWLGMVGCAWQADPVSVPNHMQDDPLPAAIALQPM